MPAPEQPNDAPTTFMGQRGTTEDDVDLAQESLTNDMHNDPQDARPTSSSSSDSSPEHYDTSPNVDEEEDNIVQSPSSQRRYSLSSSYSRPSFIAAGNSRSTVVSSLQHRNNEYLTQHEREAGQNQERALLRDNKIISKQKSRTQSNADSNKSGIFNAIKRTVSKGGYDGVQEDILPDHNDPSETTPLIRQLDLPINDNNDLESAESIDKKWDEALQAGQIHTTWQRELKVLFRSSRSLILAFILQYSIPVTSIFMVGHLGKVELGAVSLGSMTCSITGYAVYIGLATSLDTLCAQAYGSGRKKLVGLQMQRMVYFLWTCTIPIGIIWLCGTWILQAIVPEQETARMAGLYLKIALIGAPGYAAFESGKRFMQAQGLFGANMCVLLVCAPLNVFLQWLFVYRLDLGYIGAPMGLVITEICMPLGLVLYVRFVAGSECWGGFSRAAFTNWWPMIRLALPGMAMVLAEFLCFEILALSASWMSSLHLAANSILMSTCAYIYQIPFPISVCASNRIANLIGATLEGPARTATKVSMVVACCVGLFNMIILSSLRTVIPRLMTNEEDVIELVSKVLLVCAGFQFFDATAAFCNGVLRGIGKQEFGGYVALICYYGVGLPISFGTGFGLGWELYGLWAGPAVALALTVICNGTYIFRVDWTKCVEDAKRRNSAA